jgi:glucans biosynthesis protein
MLKRLQFIIALAVTTACFACATMGEEERPTHKFDRQWLENRAAELAKEEYVEAVIDGDSPLNQLNYDDYKKIQFQRSATIWKNEDRNFRLIPLHPGFLFKTPVKLNLVVGGVSRRILYTSEIYQYDKDQIEAKTTEAKGYSGFSVTTPINNDTKWDEFLVFQGGTYFRAVGKNNWYGLSARGLAVNTAKPEGEEFPVFTDFWIERPKEGSDTLVVHALMNSPSVTGAFSYEIVPGEATTVTVNSTLYPRTDITSFGVGTLTSMFVFDAIDKTRFDDFRPAVHDSNGLHMVLQNGERIWRPLSNPVRLQASVFQDESPTRFGLLQRKRAFADFDDMEAKYEDRPSAWVEPIGDWGKGHVELIEIPTKSEVHDNIVAFWQPQESLKKGKDYTFKYRLKWGATLPEKDREGRIVSTASGKALGRPNVREFVIDFEADTYPEDLTIHATASTGNIVDSIRKFIPETGTMRVVVKFEPTEELAELRVSLSSANKPWGETWLYRWIN